MKTAILLLLATSLPFTNGCSYVVNLGTTSSILTNFADESAFGVNAGGTTTCTVTGNGAATTMCSLGIEICYNDNVGGANAIACASDARGFSTPGSCDIVLTTSSSSTDATTLGINVDFISTTEEVTISCTCDSPLTTPSPTPSPTFGEAPSAGPCACFSATATVQVENRGAVAMEDLKIGDRVLTGRNQYQPVYSFGHYHERKHAIFYQIFAEGSTTPLEMTGNHLVFLESQPKPIRADSVKIGDRLETQRGPVAVTEVSTTSKAGIYMPLTPDGTIMVDGVVASSYVSLQEEAPTVVEIANQVFSMSEDHILHWWLSPYRMLCLGVSSNFCSSRDEEGILPWLAIGRNILHYAELNGMTSL